MIVTVDRGLGLTTKQILAAPKNAVYVAPGSTAVVYTRSLTRQHQREDLRVVAPGWLTRAYQGLAVHVVIDHAVTVQDVPLHDRPDWHRALDCLEQRGLLKAALDVPLEEPSHAQSHDPDTSR